jgi:tetratricopeptide (TPR) repeat protein
VLGLAILAAMLAAYQPALRGGLLWDDDKHVTAPDLRSLHGLTRIWTDLGATQQYYPVAHTAFWIEHRLFGDATLGYHLVNIGLHAASALLLLVILRRLAVPGAALAAALFALHPVQVESVAWISELKNTLSGVFFMTSLLLYLRFDDDRDGRAYAASLVAFLLALMSKSVTATLPGLLLVVCWWRRGRVELRRDVMPALPFFAAGAAAGLFTAWVERTYIGAAGADFHLTFAERILIAGRAIWFYLGTIVWPHPLVFEYPRWTLDASAAWQWAFPAAALALLAACWRLRSRSRAPLAALLAFAGLLFPALGFVNVYPFRFSFVADHFQYLAIAPVLILFAAAAATLARRWSPSPWPPMAAAIALVSALALVTHAEAAKYTDAITSYRAILAENPSSWLAHTNLGALLRPTAPDEALVHLQEAVRLKPDSDLSHYNLANLLQQTERFEDAIREYRATLTLAPNMGLAYYNLGNTLLQMDRLPDAEIAYRQAIRVAPNLALAHGGLCRVLQATNRPADAVAECRTAIAQEPTRTVLHYDFAGVLQAQDRFDEAIAEYNTALALAPDSVEAHNDLAGLLGQMGRFAEARTHFEAAAALSPNEPAVRGGLCGTLMMLGRVDEASRECEAAVRLQPGSAPAHYDFANVLQRQRRLEDAVREYQAALGLDPGFAGARFNLGTALQSLGRAAEGRDEMARALRMAPNETAARMLRASALEGQGRLAEARDEYARVLSAAPSLVPARQGLARVDSALRQ